MRELPQSSIRGLLAALLPIVVLCAVGVFQVYRVETRDQIAWIGAGFGMFATVDGVDRTVLIQDARTGKTGPVPSEFSIQAATLARTPSKSGLDHLAYSLNEAFGKTYNIKIWAPVFDSRTNTLTWRLISVR